MKFNWGHGIAIVIGAFMIMILYFLFNSFTYKQELVSDDYYAKEVAYQQEIDKRENTQGLPIEAEFTEKGLVLTFPHSTAKGKLHFFRPSNLDLDFELEINADSNSQQIILPEKFKSGLWKLKADWKDKGKAYFHEQSFVAP